MAMNPVTESQNWNRITATTTIFTGSGALLGIFVTSASATPTIVVTDGATQMTGTLVPNGGTFYPIPGSFKTSLIVTISGTVDCTVFWH